MGWVNNNRIYSSSTLFMFLHSDINAPLAAAFADRNLVWAQVIIAVGAFIGLTTAEISTFLKCAVLVRVEHIIQMFF